MVIRLNILLYAMKGLDDGDVDFFLDSSTWNSDYGARTGLKTQWKGGNDFPA